MTIGQQSSAAAQRRIIVGITEPGYADHSIEADILKSLGAEVRILRWAGDRSKLLEMLDGLDIVMVRDIPVLDAEAIGRLREGGGIVRYGVGVDTIDLDARLLGESGIEGFISLVMASRIQIQDFFFGVATATNCCV